MNGTRAVTLPKLPPAALWLPALGVAMLAVFAALFAGLSAVVLPWWLILIAGVGMILTAAIAWSPLMGLVLTILLAFQAIPGTIAPDIPLGLLRAKPHEITFFLALVSLGMRQLPGLQSHRRPGLPTDFLVVTFLGLLVVVFSAVYSSKYLGNDEFVLAESRGFFALLALPALHLAIKTERDLAILRWSITAAGLAVSAYVLTQMFTGQRILAGRLEDLELSKGSGVMRSVTDTAVLVQAFAIYHLGTVVRWNRLSSLMAMAGLMLAVAGLLGTFTRGAWIGAAAGGLFAAYMRGGITTLLKTLLGGVILLSVTVAATMLVDERSALAMIDRALGIRTEITRGASFGWRQIENRVALQAMADHPLLGVGIGGAYKDILSSAGSFMNEEYLIHNSYLFFPLKMGLPGVALFLAIGWPYLVRFLRSIRLRRSERPADIAIAAGTMAMATIISIEGHIVTKFPGLLLVCTLVLLTERALRQTAKEAESTLPAQHTSTRT